MVKLSPDFINNVFSLAPEHGHEIHWGSIRDTIWQNVKQQRDIDFQIHAYSPIGTNIVFYCNNGKKAYAHGILLKRIPFLQNILDKAENVEDAFGQTVIILPDTDSDTVLSCLDWIYNCSIMTDYMYAQPTDSMVSVMKHIFGIFMEENSAAINSQNCTSISEMLHDLSKDNVDSPSSTKTAEQISTIIEPTDILDIEIASNKQEDPVVGTAQGQWVGIAQDQMMEIAQDQMDGIPQDQMVGITQDQMFGIVQVQMVGIAQDQMSKNDLQGKAENEFVTARTMPLENSQEFSTREKKIVRNMPKRKLRRCKKIKRLEFPAHWKSDAKDSYCSPTAEVRLTRNALRKSMENSGRRKPVKKTDRQKNKLCIKKESSSVIGVESQKFPEILTDWKSNNKEPDSINVVCNELFKQRADSNMEEGEVRKGEKEKASALESPILRLEINQRKKRRSSTLNKLDVSKDNQANSPEIGTKNGIPAKNAMTPIDTIPLTPTIGEGLRNSPGLPLSPLSQIAKQPLIEYRFVCPECEQHLSKDLFWVHFTSNHIEKKLDTTKIIKIPVERKES